MIAHRKKSSRSPSGWKVLAMRPCDVSSVIRLWKKSQGVGIGKSDTPARARKFLQRNPGISSVVYIDGLLVGAVLCGHDGRRGFIHHLAVAPDQQGRGLGRVLVKRCLRHLRKAGIHKCYGLIFAANRRGRKFWRKIGWDCPRVLLPLNSST